MSCPPDTLATCAASATARRSPASSAANSGTSARMSATTSAFTFASRGSANPSASASYSAWPRTSVTFDGTARLPGGSDGASDIAELLSRPGLCRPAQGWYGRGMAGTGEHQQAQAALPAGTVTLLMSDIEGSTRLLQHLHREYARLLAEHARIVRAAATRNDGLEVDTQ